MATLLENEQTIKEQQRIFDSVRPAGVRLFLLKRAGQTEKFAVVREVTSGWFASFDKQYREDLNVSVATLDAGFENDLAQSSYLGYGSVSPLDVYKFEKKDAVSPNAASPSWKIHAVREPNERFTVPVITDEEEDMRIASATINTNSAASQPVYTVPAGKRLFFADWGLRDSTEDFTGNDANHFVVEVGGVEANSENPHLDIGTNARVRFARLSAAEPGETVSVKWQWNKPGSFVADLIGYLVDA